jgi:SAM-dependent methyltransferase
MNMSFVSKKAERDTNILCPVCETELDATSLATMMLDTPRGNNQTWAQCPECQSFFSVDQYNSKQEIEHTRTRPWGILDSGIALNDDKSPMYEAILRMLRPYAPQGGTLLDIGCSYGGFLQQAQKEGYHTRGIDIVPEAVDYVRRLGILCDCAKSVNDLDIPCDSLSIITVLDCNYYWPDQKKELRAIYSLLRSEGLLVMKVVDTSWAIQIGFWLRKWFIDAARRLCEKSVYDHRVSIPVKSLLQIVRQEGFEIVHTSQRDAMQFRHNSIKVKIAYAIGWLALRMTGCYLAPGFVLLARKRAQ